MHPRCKFGDHRSTDSIDTAHKYFCDRLETDESSSLWPSFCVRSGFASGSSHARIQVSVYSGYDLCHPGFPKMFLSIATPLNPKSRSYSRQLFHPCQMHPQCKFSDRRSLACRDNADISILMMT